jgi:hypothetical protein
VQDGPIASVKGEDANKPGTSKYEVFSHEDFMGINDTEKITNKYSDFQPENA